MTTLQLIREAIEHSPVGVPIAPDLVGWITQEDDYVCARCAGRVMARGVTMKMRRPIWKDTKGISYLRCPVCRERPKQVTLASLGSQNKVAA